MKGIVPDDILEALKKKKLGLPGIDIEAPPEKNALVMGEFNVILALIAKYPEAKVAKAQVRGQESHGFRRFSLRFPALNWLIESERTLHCFTLGRKLCTSTNS